MAAKLFRMLFFAVLIQLPAWLLVGLNSLAFQVHKELWFSGAYFAGLLVAWLANRSGKSAVGLTVAAATLLLSIYFWSAVIAGRPL